MSLATSLEAGLLILAVEFALIACGVAFAVLHRGRRTEQQQATQVTGLLSKVEATADSRREALSAIISETYHFDPAETARVVSDFIERERAFYNAMIGVHLGRGGKTLTDVPAELTKVVAPWLRLTPKPVVRTDIEALETANSVLNQELTNTKRVLDELMEEYNAAFHKEQQALRAATAAAPELESHDMLNLDDANPPQGLVTASMTVADSLDLPPPASVADILQAEGEIISLDLDTGDASPANSSDGLTSYDLDALMENLDSEYAREPAAA